jgi:hypothetical protein
VRVRTLTPAGDRAFGRSGANFLVNSPACVAQCVLTALQLWQGTWFLDRTAGAPYMTAVLGYGTKALYDLAVQQVILGVENVTSIEGYSSSLTTRSRGLVISMQNLETAFGAAGPLEATVGR